jgi:hypothetical protein
MIVEQINHNGQQSSRIKPSNDLDFQFMTTEPFISSENMSENIKNKFRKYRVVQNEKGEHVLELAVDSWTTIEMFTQDFRLGNTNLEEAFYIRFNMDLCSDILSVLPHTFNKSAFLLLERAVSVNETSQAKGGFLRRLFNTLLQYSKQTLEEVPQRRNFFGMGKKSSTGGL